VELCLRGEVLPEPVESCLWGVEVLPEPVESCLWGVEVLPEPVESCLWGVELPPVVFSPLTGPRLTNETASSAPVRKMGVAKTVVKNRNATVTVVKRIVDRRGTLGV